MSEEDKYKLREKLSEIKFIELELLEMIQYLDIKCLTDKFIEMIEKRREYSILINEDEILNLSRTNNTII